MKNLNSKSKSDISVRCYKFALGVIQLCEPLEYKISSNIIIKQLIRAATSISANIVEGKAASSRIDFKRFQQIALKSSNETKYWLCLLRDSQNISITDLLKEATEISNILGASVITLKKKKSDFNF